MSDNVSYLPVQGGNGTGGEPPMSNIEARVEHLERDMTDIKVTLARMDAKLDVCATGESLQVKSGGLQKEIGDLRAEMHSLIRQQTIWSVGTIIAMASLVFAIMRFLPSAA